MRSIHCASLAHCRSQTDSSNFEGAPLPARSASEKEAIEAPAPAAAKGKVIDLYSALKASLEKRGVKFGSERLTGALLDRLTHHVHILEMNGQSFRLKHSRKRIAAEQPAQPPD
jgi:hypothetical protein